MNGLLIALLCVPPFLIALVLVINGYRRKTRERKGCEQLLALIKATEGEQKQAVEKFLVQTLHYDAAAAGGRADELLKMRKQFMRKLLLGFLHRDVAAVAALDNELSQLTNAYHKLEAKLASAAPPAANKAENTGETHVVRLQQENQRLRHEIHITLSTLNNIFAEYSSMFGNDEGDRNLSVAQIVDRMQQLSGGGAAEALEKAAVADEAAQPAPEEDVLSSMPAIDADLIADAASQIDSSAADEPSWEDAFSEAAKQNDQ